MTPTAEDVLRLGPLLLFGMAVAETAVPAGVLVPAGVALATGAFLAHQGLMAWEVVIPASAAGALVGDSVGYWLGRTGSPLLERTPGAVGRVTRKARVRVAVLFDRHSLAAVSGARMVAFVRTFMPPTAGGSGISYPRFLAFDVAGVAGWVLLYVALGLGVGEGWRAWAAGSGLEVALFVFLGGVLAWMAVRWRRSRARRRRERRARPPAGGGTGPPGADR